MLIIIMLMLIIMLIIIMLMLIIMLIIIIMLLIVIMFMLMLFCFNDYLVNLNLLYSILQCAALYRILLVCSWPPLSFKTLGGFDFVCTPLQGPWTQATACDSGCFTRQGRSTIHAQCVCVRYMYDRMYSSDVCAL
jgi:hypothetical protein